MEDTIIIDGVEYVRKDSIPKATEGENAGVHNTGDWNTGHKNTGDLNAGDENTGHKNTGNWNTGNRNTGSWNAGNYNTGHKNTRDKNAGDENAGSYNTGYYNTGSGNAGNRNTGGWNAGNHNVGNWNAGDWNTGCLNTTEPKVRIFNKDCDTPREKLEFPNYFYFDITEWILENDMTEEEKKVYPSYKVTGGYLKEYEYKEAFRKSWDKADDEDRRKTLSLPNWDNELFKEISGIDVEKELGIKTKEYSVDEIAKALGVDVAELKIKRD